MELYYVYTSTSLCYNANESDIKFGNLESSPGFTVGDDTFIPGSGSCIYMNKDIEKVKEYLNKYNNGIKAYEFKYEF